MDLPRDGLWGMWWRLLRSARNSVRRMVVDEPVRLLGVLLVIGTVWLLIWGLTQGLLLMLSSERYLELKAPLLRSLLNLFFFALFFMVVLSTALVVWSGLFRTDSARFHAQLPLSNRALFWSAAVEGGLWAGWAVLVLSLPLVVGLSSESQQGLRFVFAALAVLAAFLLCCMAAGALGSVVLARIIPAVRRGWRGLLLLGLGIVLALTFIVLGGVEADQPAGNFLREVMGRIRFIENPYLPPLWTQRAIDAAMISHWSGWWYYVGLLVSTGIACAIVAEWIAVRRLRRDLDLLAGRAKRGGRRGASRPWRLFPGLPRDIALLVAKDLRLFKRDPAQLLQFGLFFGLLGFYILMLPRIGMAFKHEEWWATAVSLLNLTAVSMALATFTGRFVYPLLSLEGKRLWVLILAPWERTRIVTAKFVFALLVGVPISVVLVSLSGLMLEIEGAVIAYQAYVTVCMGLGLAAAALGIGAKLADYHEDNPAKLVAGYGGTVNLLASLLFAALLLTGAALPLALGQLGDWRWAAGIGWTGVITVIWTSVGLFAARRYFGRASG